MPSSCPSAGAWGVLCSGVWRLVSVPFLLGYHGPEGWSSSTVREGNFEEWAGEGAGSGSRQLLSERNFSLTPRIMAHFSKRVIQFVRNIHVLSWCLVKSLFLLSWAGPSSARIIPVRLPSGGIMLRTVCIVEDYLFPCRYSPFIDTNRHNMPSSKPDAYV